MAMGTPGTEGGDSIACRQYHAGTPAQFDPTMHCPHAGITGADTCSGPVESGAQGRCASFCHMALALCDPNMLAGAGLDASAIPFADEPACLAACGKGTGPHLFDFDHGLDELVLSGDTLNCREYHLGAAYDDPATSDGRATESAKAECPKLRPNNGIFGDNPCTAPEVDAGADAQ